MISNVVRQALALAQSGGAAQGLALIREAQVRGEADAFHLEGLWLLEGRFLPRDFAAAREAFAAAERLGHVGAARTLSGLVACGIGAPPDWTAALGRLEQWADRDPVAARQLELIERMAIDDEGNPNRAYEPCTICEGPRIERVDGLITQEECSFLIELVQPRMQRATIFHEGEQRFIEDPIRRSDKAAFSIVSEWPFVRAINRRIAAATATAVECGEPLQILRYGPTQEYQPHFDAIAGMDNPRVLTALTWLNEDYEGGETRFDRLGLSERGRTGDLMLFANTHADGSPDERTLHSGAPVVAGAKYMASRWIRAHPPGERGFGRHEVERS
ncbi:MAG TPA: 2OG-Fe(II) oxygenase [Sphingomicrobium sp.]|nr:2OG-Fe(II) oxygenase [Sphingomicrobium sp.]